MKHPAKQRRLKSGLTVWLVCIGGGAALCAVLYAILHSTALPAAAQGWYVLAAAGAFALLAAVIASLVAARRRRAIRAIDRYLARIGDGDLPSQPLNCAVGGEIGAVADSVNAMAQAFVARERHGGELSVAAALQLQSLPHTFPAFPKHKEFDIYAHIVPSREVGGDFYDMFLLDDTHIAVVIGDVSGRGVPATLFMVLTKVLIKNYTQAGLSPAEVFTKVNDILCDNNESRLFVTAWLGILDTETGKLVFASAGHNAPFLSHDGKFTPCKAKHRFVLAGMRGVLFRQEERILSPRDRLFLYTDGVTDAIDAKHKLYGTARLGAFLDDHAEDEIAQVLTDLEADVRRFSGGQAPDDDLTMLMLHYRKRAEAEVLHEQIFPAADEALADVTAFVNAELEHTTLPSKTAMQILIAVEEMFVNIAHYAYPHRKGTVTVGVAVQDTQIKIRLIDAGAPFNPLERGDPDISLSAEQRSVGGLGIFMVKKIMDHVTYRYDDGKNILTMVKRKETH